jgi:hypothetical protein
MKAEPILMWGDAKVDTPLLAWSDVERRLREAITYWLVVDGAASRPVWGIWHDDELWLSVGSTMLWKGLRSSPKASAHLDDGHDVAIVEGTARFVEDPDLLAPFVDVYNPKYNWDFTPTNTLGPIVVLAPRVVLAWKAGSYENAKNESYPLAAARFVF